MDQSPNMKVNVDPIKARMLCSKCGGIEFIQVCIVLKVVSPIIGQDVVPIAQPAGFNCAKCGKILNMDDKTVGDVEDEEKKQMGDPI